MKAFKLSQVILKITLRDMCHHLDGYQSESPIQGGWVAAFTDGLIMAGNADKLKVKSIVSFFVGRIWLTGAFNILKIPYCLTQAYSNLKIDKIICILEWTIKIFNIKTSQSLVNKIACLFLSANYEK